MQNRDSTSFLAADMAARYGRAAGEILRRRADDARNQGDTGAAAAHDGAAAAADLFCLGATLR